MAPNIQVSPEKYEAERFAFSTPGKTTTPEQIEAFLFAWSDRMKKKIIRSGFDETEAEEIFQDLIIKWIKRDYISTYRVERNVPISSFVLGYVEANIRRFQDNKRRWETRKAAVEELDTNGVSYEIPEPPVAVIHAASVLDRYPKTQTQNLSALLITLFKQVEYSGRIKQQDVAKMLGVTPRAVGHQMDRLREQLVENGLVAFDSKGNVSWTI